jgi:hypothetical protein
MIPQDIQFMPEDETAPNKHWPEFAAAERNEAEALAQAWAQAKQARTAHKPACKRDPKGEDNAERQGRRNEQDGSGDS